MPIRWTFCAYLGLVAVYLTLSARTHWLPALVPDDLHFFATAWNRIYDGAVATDGWIATVFAQRNWEGFGSTYWLTLAATAVAGEHRFAVARALSFSGFAAICGAFGWLAWRRREPDAALLACGLWLSMPLAWWCGKINGVDVPLCTAVAIGGVILLDRPGSVRHAAAAMALFGLAAGLKLVGASALVFGATHVLLTREHRRVDRLTLLLGAMPAVGFFAANPYALLHPFEFARSLLQYSSPTRDLWMHARQIFSARSYYHWDQAFDGGLLTWGGSFLLITLGVAAARVERAALLAFAAAAGFAALMLLRTNRYYGWYWFPSLTLAPLVLATLRADWWVRAACAVAIAANVVTTLPSILSERRSKEQQAANLDAAPLVETCIAARVGSRRFDIVSDFSETSRLGGARGGSPIAAEALRALLSSPSGLVLQGPLRDRLTADALTPARTLLLVLGERLNDTLAFRDRQSLATRLEKLTKASWRIEPLPSCGFVVLLIAERSA